MADNKSKRVTTIPKKVKEQLSYLAVMFERILGIDVTEFHNYLITYNDSPENLSIEERLFMERVYTHLLSKGVSYEMMLHNKDLFMSGDLKKAEGSFFTPLRWAKKAQNLVVDAIGEKELKDYVVWDTSCGSGNLLLEIPPCKHVYFSTLNGEDVPIVEERFSKRADKQPFTAFQLDFLGSVDSVFLNEFTDQLPKGLQDVLKNKGKLAIIINPPYATSGTNTFLGRELSKRGLTDFRVDLYHQFVWQVVNLINHWGIEDFEFVLMTSGSLHLNQSAKAVVKLLSSELNYDGGFLYPASDFEGVDGGFVWAISVTHWSRHKEVPHRPAEVLEMDVLETSSTTHKQVNIDGVTYRNEFDIKKLFTTTYPVRLPRRFSKWVQGDVKVSKDIEIPRVSVYGDSVLADSKGATQRVKATSSDVLGYVDVRETLRSAPQYIQVSTLPSSSDNVVVTEENFDRLVFYFNFALRNKSWSDLAFQRLIAPIQDDFYKDVYFPNAVVHFLLSRKNFAYSVRELSSPDGILSYPSKLFWVSDEDVLTAIQANEDEYSRQALMADFEKYRGHNRFAVEVMKKYLSSEAVTDSIRETASRLEGIHLKYLRLRRVRPDFPLDSAFDLDYAQIRRLPNFDLEDERYFYNYHNEVWADIESLNRKLNFNYGDIHVND